MNSAQAVAQERKTETSIESPVDILLRHGVFVYLGYFILFYLGNISFTRNWFRFGKSRWWKQIALHESGKTLPWWQDLGVLILVLITLGLWWLADLLEYPRWLAWVSGYIIFIEFISYHARVLWFDDLEPKKRGDALKVFSHRRILAQAVVNYAQSILLFGVIYKCTRPNTANPFQGSFDVATTLTRPTDWTDAVMPHWLTNIQVAVAVFFLVAAINIVATMAYTRQEIQWKSAANPNPEKEA